MIDSFSLALLHLSLVMHVLASKEQREHAAVGSYHNGMKSIYVNRAFASWADTILDPPRDPLSYAKTEWCEFFAGQWLGNNSKWLEVT